jgi:hypothetical protein
MSGNTASAVAHMNYGLLRHGWNDKRSAGFVDAAPRVSEIAHRFDGFVWQMDGRDIERQVVNFPKTFPDTERLALTLSVWASQRALELFTYHSLHGRYLARRAEWFEPIDAPTYVLWSVPRDHRPDIAEAVGKLDKLRDSGPTDQAFVFGYQPGRP